MTECTSRKETVGLLKSFRHSGQTTAQSSIPSVMNSALVKKILPVVVVLIAAYFGVDLKKSSENTAESQASGATSVRAPQASGDSSTLEAAIKQQRSDVQVEASGTVVRVLADDNEGSRHQRFILKLASGRTLLIAHNIDLAPRIPNLREGDSVQFFGEYEWSDQGGVVHWTHRDPGGRHEDGWLKHRGKTYQ